MPLVGTRYLYADSDPFPYEYDFLATLKGFLEAASSCLVATAELERLRGELSEKSDEVAHEIEHLDVFQSQLVDTIDRMGHAGGAVGEVARTISATATKMVHDAKAVQKGELGRLEQAAAAQMESSRAIIRQSVSKFFTGSVVDFTKSSFRLSLEDGAYVMRAVCLSPTNVEIAYRLDVNRSEGWNHPRKVSEIVGDEMMIQVGLKKKFLKRDLTREIVNVDDFYITGASLDPRSAQVRLRKKLESGPDLFVLHMHRVEGDTQVAIERPGNDDSTPFPAVADDTAKLERLWAGLERAAREVLEHRQAVDWVHIDGKDMIEHDLVVLMIDRFVEMYAPVVQEISNRSSSPKELSLKRELASGRREELYIRKEELAELLAPLDEDRLRLFARLEVFPTISVDVD